MNNYETSPGNGTVKVATDKRCFASSAIKHNNQYKIIVFKKANKNIGDQSDNAFTIVAQPIITSISPNQVVNDLTTTADTNAVIYGTNLSGATNIEFYHSNGQIAGSLVPGSVGATEILFKISHILIDNIGPGTYQVGVVTNACPSGCKSNRLPFTVTQAATSLQQIRQNVALSAASPLSPTQVGLSAGQTIAVFKITNNNTAPIYLGSGFGPSGSSNYKPAFLFLNSGSTSTLQSFSLLTSAQGGAAIDVSVTFDSQSISSTAASGTLPLAFYDGSSEANRTINGGTWRYFTIRTQQVANNNDTFQVSTGDLSNIKFYVKEADFGQSLNSDSDIVDTILGLSPIGSPTSTALVTATTTPQTH